MKKIATLTLGCLLAFTATKAQTFSDDFESYTLTTPLLGIQSPLWRTWSSTTGGGAEDVAVVSTDNHTVAGSKSIYFSSTSATGGPQDVILPFSAGAPLTTGQFSWKSWFKIPTGKSGYFNFQGTATMGGMYVLDCFMTGGNIQIQNSGTIVASATQPVGTWFEMEIKANFNSNSWELLINGVSQGTWSNANNQVWGIDYYPADAAASFWIDDVSYNVTPYTLPALNAAGNMLDISNGLVGSVRYPAVKVRNLGTAVINSFDISITQNGGAPVVKNVTGLTLASLASTIQTYTVPFTLVTGTNTFVATISNVNGAGADGDASDNVLTTIVTPVTPAAGKMVVAEEGTGTWCQWCPRGAVYMDLMDTKYSGFIAPIAVHNADPMTVTTYDAAIGALIGGYPSALVDRLPEIDPSGIETDFLTRIIVAPKAFVLNGATYNSTTRVLNVSVTSTVQSTLTGNYKVACVITEDDVTGTGSTYAQSNAYAGGAAGVMGGFESLANPVPASQMVYDHVARFISPDFAGIANAAGTSTAVGSVFTWNFTFTLPASYDDTQIHIVGLFIDPTGKIDNAASTTIPQAVANGFVSGTGVGINDIAGAPDAQVSIYPNPSSDYTSITLNLTKASDVSVMIYSVDGSLVGSKSYGELNGGMLLPVDMTRYTAGMYFVNVTIGGTTSVLKLIKK